MKSKLNLLLIFILIAVLAFSGFQCTRQNRAKPITLVVWNLGDNSTSAAWSDIIISYQTIIAADQTKAPIKIQYTQKLISGNEQYEKELNEALIQGKGPDIITLNNSWLPRYKNKIYPLDQGAKTAQDYQRKFVDVVSYDFLEGNKIYAMPLSLDTLALYYNIDILNSAGIFDPPRTWDEFNEAVRKLTLRDEKGNIKRAGAAIGTSQNINRSSDILSLLMLQSGSSIVDDSHTFTTFNNSVGATALQYYTDFANPAKTLYTWNPLMDYSVNAFSASNAAMMINYADVISAIRAKNSNLRFAVSPMLQNAGVTVPVNYANYWAMAVSAGSAHPAEAWDFLIYITNPEINKAYLIKTAKPAAQRDLVSWQENGDNLNLAVFARQSLTAKSWYQEDNFAAETIFNDAINSIVLGRSTAENASALAASQLNQTMKK